MYSQLNKPQNRLSKDAIKVWIISETIMNSIGFIILGILLYLDHLYLWKAWIGWILIGITVLFVLGTIWSCINPFLLYKNWRYGLDEAYLQLKSGVLNESHKLVPMTKVQSVATNQGPLLRKYGLYAIKIDTIASSHTIPALPKDVAIQLRNQIAHYAKIKEVE